MEKVVSSSRRPRSQLLSILHGFWGFLHSDPSVWRPGHVFPHSLLPVFILAQSLPELGGAYDMLPTDRTQ